MRSISMKYTTRLLKEFINEYNHIARPRYGLEGEISFRADNPELVTEPSRFQLSVVYITVTSM
jgi:hypothetical protein